MNQNQIRYSKCVDVKNTMTMISDLNKGITEILYNHLNLPTQISFANGKSIEYLYNAAGIKVEKKVHDTQNNTIKQVEYMDGFQYAGGILQFFPHAEGYIAATQNENSIGPKYIYNYVYNYTDHLGNIRLSYTRDPLDLSLKIMEENHSTSCASFDLEILNFQNLTCPFGLKHAVYADPKQMYRLDEEEESLARPTYVYETEYQYKYNGKEFQDELGLNMYDYGARNYDPAIGRWMNIDLLAESFLHSSPYVYALNNPMYYIDPDGMSNEGFYTRLVNEGTGEEINIDDGIDQTLTVSNSIFNSVKKYRNSKDPMSSAGYQDTLFDAISYSLSKNGTTS